MYIFNALTRDYLTLTKDIFCLLTRKTWVICLILFISNTSSHSLSYLSPSQPRENKGRQESQCTWSESVEASHHSDRWVIRKWFLTFYFFFSIFFFFFFYKSAEGCNATCSVAMAGRCMKGRGCVDDKAPWCVMCGWQMCISKAGQGCTCNSDQLSQVHTHSGQLYVRPLGLCVCVRVSWPWSRRFMHDSTERRSIVLSLMHTYVCLYSGAMLQQPSAPQSLSWGPKAKFSAHVQRSLMFCLFLSPLLQLKLWRSLWNLP